MAGKAILERRVIPEGERIFREGDAGDSAYIVQRGTVDIFRERDGESKSLGQVTEGGIFGEMALIDNQPRMASARAQTMVTVIVVSRQMFERKMSASDPFIRGLLKILAQNIRRATGGQRPPPEALQPNKAPPMGDDVVIAGAETGKGDEQGSLR